MADGLTQLQDALDQLATQMFASLRYISAHHSLSPIPNQPFHGHSEPSAAAAPTITGAANHTSPADAQNTQQQQQPQSQEQSTQQGDANETPQQLKQEEDWDPNLPPRPETPKTFAAALEELAQDLVKKEQQIESLIEALPGQGRSREEQEARLQELDAELRGVEGEVAAAAQERDELCGRVERVMWKISRW